MALETDGILKGKVVDQTDPEIQKLSDNADKMADLISNFVVNSTQKTKEMTDRMLDILDQKFQKGEDPFAKK